MLGNRYENSSQQYNAIYSLKTKDGDSMSGFYYCTVRLKWLVSLITHQTMLAVYIVHTGSK